MWSAHKHQQGLQVWELGKDSSTDWSGEGHHDFLRSCDSAGRRTFSKWWDVMGCGVSEQMPLASPSLYDRFDLAALCVGLLQK